MSVPPRRNALVEHSLELLSSLGSVSAQPMFGGHGLCVDGVFIGLIAFDCLYLKVDEHTRPQFAAAGCEPFVYTARGRPMTMSYWTVPPPAMDSPELMRPWARLALDAARRAMASKAEGKAVRPRASPRKTSARPAGREN